MAIYLVRRTTAFALTLLVGTVVVFAFMMVLPGDPAAVALGTSATPEAIAELHRRFGTDLPLFQQYLNWVAGMVRGDFGVSYVTAAPIGPQIVDRLLVTMWLAFSGMGVSLVLALPLGFAAAIHHRRSLGTLVSFMSQVGISIPNFLAGIALITLFAVQLGWLPAGGWVPPNRGAVPFLRSLALPAISLGLVQGAILARYVRTSIVNIQREDFIRTARAKGLRSRQALIRHGLRNAAIPILTVSGVQLATLLIGTIVVERVFVIPGAGSLLLDGLANRDILLVMGVVMVLVIGVLLINYMVDLMYSIIDPRIRVNR